MAERDFEAEFSAMMVPLAADDAELKGHFRAAMFGPEVDAPGAQDRAFVVAMNRIEYDLDELGSCRAVGRCVAGLAGVQLGSEFFDGQA